MTKEIMPIIKSAIKKLRKDRVRTARNQLKKDHLKTLIKKVRSSRSPTDLNLVFSALDKAAKTNLIHRNKASRLKSRLSELIAQPSSAQTTSPTKKSKKAAKQTQKTRK